MLNYVISNADLMLIDSYKVSKWHFRKELKSIFYEGNNSMYAVWNRSICGMCLEWAVHNACYALHIKRSSTKDVDLNYPRTFWEWLGYTFFGCLVWIFIE